MHIVFADVGDVVVHDVRQVVDVDAACRDVGRHQGPDVAALEAGQRLRARSLALVAVQCQRLDAVLDQVFSDVVGAEFGAREDQHLTPVVFGNDVRQQRFLLAATDRVDQLRDALHRGVARRHLNAQRVFQQRGGEFADLIAEGGREQQALLVLGHHGQHFFHVMDKAHVEHAVGFVEHQDLYLTEIEHALLQQIEQTARCRHQNVDALFDAADLRVHANTAEDDGRCQFQVFAIGLHRFLDLGSEFTRRGQDQGADADAAEFVFGCCLGAEFVQHGQHKGCRFAGAGLGAAEQVVAGQHGGNALCLNRGRGFIALLKHGLNNGRSQIEFFEVHSLAPILGAVASACNGAGAPNQSKADGVQSWNSGARPRSQQVAGIVGN